MKLDALLSTIILVSFLVTIMMAVGSYVAYKLREARRPHVGPEHASFGTVAGETIEPGESLFFQQVRAHDVATASAAARGVPRG